MASALLTRDEHLEAFYKSFLAKRYRKSALEELEREKKKASKKPLAKAATGPSLDALGRLLDERFCQLLPKGNARQDQDFVRRAIAKFKLTNCYVLSEDERYDQQSISVEVALTEIVSVGPTSLIFFMPSQVAYLEGHSPGERYLCLREGEASDASYIR
ncbi:hypothetical protein [Hymenobacter guriensis]|uniref:Uncharacterized protein n=1 Tax=Hymenobacter guriensis TaxID=2793065 RepID=A0ABS0L6Q8_9BACT|nr:hypothetical protein [Hymenobacter guriensis]MBG8555047.1 hypothetical protein [Hymenobacter guriensis]